VPPWQLVVGMPYYGHGWTGVPAGNDFGLYQSATGTAPAPGVLDSAPGTADYNELANLPGYSWHFDPVTGASWIYNPTTQTFWSIENPAEVYEKALYIDAHGLAGASVWNLAGDSQNALTSALTAGLQQGGPGSGDGPGFGGPGHGRLGGPGF
jgi:chitinase